MLHGKKRYMAAFVLITAGIAYAADIAAPSVKTYSVTDLKSIVSNHSHCQTLYTDLQKVTKKPILLQFIHQSGQSFAVQDANNKLTKHSYAIVKQDADNNIVNRVGMGSFEVKGNKFDYVVEISGDVKHDNHKYHYPIILSSEAGHCYFTGLVRPSAGTVATFKKSIQTGHASEGSDLSRI